MIGIFLPSTALDVSKIKYALKLIKIFDKEEYTGKVIIFVYKRELALLKNDVSYLSIEPFGFSKLRKIVMRLKKKMRLNYDPDFKVAINKYGIKYAIFPTPSKEIMKCSIPYAASFQSLGHRLNPELPEISQDGVWKLREDIYSVVCNNAQLIFIDSEIGKEYLKFYYNPKGEIIVIPHTMPDELNISVSEEMQLNILAKYNLTKDYLFYPAQLWPHKNHVRILEAVKYLKNKGIDLHVVFTGSNKKIRNKYGVEYMLEKISATSGMMDNLIITGYLSKEEIKTFYLNAFAMIMPQLIPEPCIPYSEAMKLGCPIIASDIHGIKEQVNGAGVLVDPYNIKSIAEGIELLLDKRAREKCIEKGVKNYKSIEASETLSFSLIDDIINALTKIPTV